MDTDHARQEFLTAFRRIVAVFLALMLLVAFWADRPTAAASVPKPVTKSTLLGDSPEVKYEEPKDTAGISLLRKPWLTFYVVLGAPPLNRGPLTAEEEGRFRAVVGSIAAAFFLASGCLLFIGRRFIQQARDNDV